MGRKVSGMSIGQICTRGPVTVPLDASLEEAAGKMLELGVGAVIVTDANVAPPAVAGILTDRDIVRARLGQCAALSTIRVAGVMTRNPLVFDESESLVNALRALRARAVRRAPVLGHDGRLIGLLSSDDLLAELAAELGALAQVVARQGRGRRH